MVKESLLDSQTTPSCSSQLEPDNSKEIKEIQSGQGHGSSSSVAPSVPPNQPPHSGGHEPDNSPESKETQISKPQPDSVCDILTTSIALFLYVSLGTVLVYLKKKDFCPKNSDITILDAYYFSIVTMCTIGYGDITPNTGIAKIFVCVFALIGIGVIEMLLIKVVNRVLEWLENYIVTRNFSWKRKIVDEEGRMKTTVKVGLALAAVVLFTGTLSLVLRNAESLEWGDSFYLAIMSVTTVGYGDMAFKTRSGRAFAVAWLLFSSLVVAQAYLYFADVIFLARRRRQMHDWFLLRDFTVEDFREVDADGDGVISELEFENFKLIELGNIPRKDILQIREQYRKLNPNEFGKITLTQLEECRS